MDLRPSVLLALALLLGSFQASAQGGAGPVPSLLAAGPASAAMGYTVTGRVVCADTQRPARFAQVMLVPATNGGNDFDRGHMAGGRTDLDGRFLLENVSPGDYYVTAEQSGYINDAPAVRLALSQGGDALNTIAGVPRVQVTAGGASVQLSLVRGATLAGVVQWDDGSPAAGVQVNAQAAPTTGTAGVAVAQGNSGFDRGAPFLSFGNSGQTDDRGRFRLSGLPPGSYVLRATVQSPLPQGSGPGQGRFQRLMSLSVYAPNKLRKTDASVITLAAGEERPDVNVVLALNGMHTVAGEVSSTAAAVRSGSVVLTDQTDPTLSRRGYIGSDGSFVVPYVPPGNYSLRVTASSQAAGAGRGGGDDNPTRFQPFQESVTVADSDLSGISVNVTPTTASQ